MEYRRIKRALDLILILVALPFLALLMVVIALLVRLSLGSPVLFRQPRLGQGGVPFMLVKFRTMTNAGDAQGQLLPDSERLPAFGRWLRATSLDELPELLNILRGEMSLVGPRPLLVDYADYYTPQQARRQDVRPGLTGWAQVNGRNAVSWEERFKLDQYYVEHCSLRLDVEILFRTILNMMRPGGVSAEGHATMPRFDEEVRAGHTPGRLPKTDGADP